MKKYLLTILFALCINFGAFAAPGSFDIVAVVGDDAISNMDVEQRLELVISSSGMKNNRETKERLRPQIIKNLINESLYLEEAKRLRIKATKQDLKAAIMNLEQQNDLQPGSFDDFLKRNNIPIEATKDQIKSQVIWGKIISQRIRPKIIITDRELDEKLEHISNSTGISELNISEIVLPVDNPDDAKRVKSLANKLASEIRQEGIEFASIAKEFSHSSTASTGGELGWVREEHAPKDIISKVRNLQVGEISDPFYTSGNYYIVRLNERRALVSETSADSSVKIRHAFVPIDQGAPASKIDDIASNVKTNAAKFQSCEGFGDFAKNVNSAIKPDMITASLSELNPDVRAAITQTDAGQLTPVIPGPSGVHIFAVCEKPEQEKSIVLKEKVKMMILRQKIDMQAQRYLRNLRSKAFIEIRT